MEEPEVPFFLAGTPGTTTIPASWERVPLHIWVPYERYRMSGLRVELTVGDPSGCPVVETARRNDATATDVRFADSTSGTAEQFRLGRVAHDVPEPVDAVFSYGEEGVYEFERTWKDCVCEAVQGLGHLVSDVRADESGLTVSLHLADENDLSAVLSTLRDEYRDVSIRSVVRSTPESAEVAEIVPVDRGRLTDRQVEVLETAYTMGYFQYPRESNATEVAESLGIQPSTFTEHLAAAQTKLLNDVLGAEE